MWRLFLTAGVRPEDLEAPSLPHLLALVSSPSEQVRELSDALSALTGSTVNAEATRQVALDVVDCLAQKQADRAGVPPSTLFGTGFDVLRTLMGTGDLLAAGATALGLPQSGSPAAGLFGSLPAGITAALSPALPKAGSPAAGLLGSGSGAREGSARPPAAAPAAPSQPQQPASRSPGASGSNYGTVRVGNNVVPFVPASAFGRPPQSGANGKQHANGHHHSSSNGHSNGPKQHPQQQRPALGDGVRVLGVSGAALPRPPSGGGGGTQPRRPQAPRRRAQPPRHVAAADDEQQLLRLQREEEEREQREAMRAVDFGLEEPTSLEVRKAGILAFWNFKFM